MFFEETEKVCVNSLGNNNIMNMTNQFCTNEDSIKSFIKNEEFLLDVEAANGGFLVYMKPTCPYCIRAISLIDDNNLHSNKINVNECSEKFSKLKNILNVRTVPQIFDVRDPKNIKYVGGCDNFVQYDLTK